MALEWMEGTLGWGSIVLFVLLLLYFAPGRRPHNFPPGLPMLPLVGSLIHMRGAPTRTKLRSLHKKYGNVAGFGMFGTGVVLVSSVPLIKKFFAINEVAGRPPSVLTTTRNLLLSEGVTTNLGILGGDGPRWQVQRRFVLRHLRDLGFGKTSNEALMMDEVTELIDYIKQRKGTPMPMKRLFNRSVVNVLWGMVMGKRYSYDNAKLTKVIDTFIQPADINLIHPIFSIPGIMRAIIYIPVLKEKLKPIINLIHFIKDELRDFMANEDLRKNFSLVSTYLKEVESRDNDPNFDMNQMAAVTLEMFGAGMDTTTTTLTMGMYLLSKYQAVQQKLQQELDDVVGRDRLPSFHDMDRLPYTQATIHEMQRKANLVAIIIHASLGDFTFEGYHIPKGSLILANMEDAMLNPKLWKNPYEFDPENFLDDKGNFVKNEAFMPFGTGKRICIAETLVRKELFFLIACLLHRFTFTVDNEDALPDNEYTFSAAVNFSAIGHPRSPL
nr:cytochrome P450 2L1-like isoform X2 [Procambarus clarkii]XP_045595439.1 cytochrome P450 2L1-like isoform X2 [Procambarus clarkii]XP_045595440.1 cytochrome P450 2L1-like isoform X2 [Procambarus clarkii]